MKKQMLSLLNAFYYNAALGADAIRGILSKAQNEHFKRLSSCFTITLSPDSYYGQLF